MGIIRDSFVMFKNWSDAINALPEEYQLECYKAVVSFGINGVMPEGLSPVATAMLISFSKGMENNIARYNASVENGKKGGRPPKNENLEKPRETQENLDEPSKENKNLDKPNHNLNVNVNDNVNVNNNIKEEEKEKKEEERQQVGTPSSSKRFVKPTIEEIKEYCRERKNRIDAENFYNFYESKGWKVGNQPMKNWKSCIITWEKREKQEFKKSGGCENARGNQYSSEELNSCFTNIFEADI